uniref:Uncharacterized protein n=1 Tax=Arundo donax TaxID=35708 RepID=A0A0A9FTN9_ARUDO
MLKKSLFHYFQMITSSKFWFKLLRA